MSATRPNDHVGMVSEDDLLDMALEDSFPASDPVSSVNPSRGVKAAHGRQDDRKSRRSILEFARELLDLQFRPGSQRRR